VTVKPCSSSFEAHGIALRPLREEDLSLTLAWRNREGVRQRFVNPEPIAPAAHSAWFAKYLDKTDDIVFIATQGGGGPCIGQLAIYAIDMEQRQAEIGRFVAAPQFQGRGLMRMALQALIDRARDELQLRRLVLSVRSDNARAIRLYAGLGFAEVSRGDGLVNMVLAL
jgi:RimJ/RimL family protein N-acetyltransferase